MSTRLPDWERRLHDFIVANRDRPFAWGSWDCILFATACVEAITGEDKASAYRGRYSDRRGAALALRELGSGTLVATVDAGLPVIEPAFAGRGDLMLYCGSVGVCMGAYALFVGEEAFADTAGVPYREGLVQIPRALCTRAWRV